MNIVTLTLFHTIISIVAITACLVVVGGLIAGVRIDGWIGIISLIVLPFVVAARYWKHLGGPWRGIYVIGTVLVLYLNFFVLMVQLFRRIPALLAAAPKQTEPPFVLSQLLVLALFVWLGLAAFRRFRPQIVVTTKQATAPNVFQGAHS